MKVSKWRWSHRHYRAGYRHRLYLWRQFIHHFGIHWWHWSKDVTSVNAAMQMGLSASEFWELAPVDGRCHFCDVKTHRDKDSRKS